MQIVQSMLSLESIEYDLNTNYGEKYKNVGVISCITSFDQLWVTLNDVVIDP